MKIKKILKARLCASILLVLLAIQLAAADFPTLPAYFQNPNVPHQNINLQTSSEINLYTGSFIQEFNLKVPQGTNNLQPDLSIFYSNQLFGETEPSKLSNAWRLSENYIQRRINYTSKNISDDYFTLVLNNQVYDLVYSPSESKFNTKIQNFFSISNQSGGNNTYKIYWTVKDKEGTNYRFGYNNDSESTSIYNYTWRWYLDLVNDTYANTIAYTYRENPYTNESGATYPLKIEYNNDKQRVIDFVLDSNNRSDQRTVMVEGNMIRFTKNIKEIKMSANGSLVRKYLLNYTNSPYYGQIANITEYGINDSFALPSTSFGYTSLNPTFSLAGGSWTVPSGVYFHEGYINNGYSPGVWLADINRDGKVDLIKSYCASGTEFCHDNPGSIIKQVWLNTGSGWSTSSSPNWTLPDAPFAVDQSLDTGTRVEDLNNDGLADIIQLWRDAASPYRIFRSVWINNGTAFVDSTSNWTIPGDVFFHRGHIGYDEGWRFADLNGDNLPDIIQSSCSNIATTCYDTIDSTRAVYINNGKGWVNDTYNWTLPARAPFITNNGQTDPGTRLVDINNDGLIDIVQHVSYASGLDGEPEPPHAPVSKVWLNNASGFIDFTPNWTLPDEYFVTAGGGASWDNGLRFIDINGDGFVDIIKAYCGSTPYSCYSSGSSVKVWLNNGRGWVTDTQGWTIPSSITFSASGTLSRDGGTMVADVDGDGVGDLVQLYKGDSGGETIQDVWLNNGRGSFLLNSTQNSFGGKTNIAYQKTTALNNTGNDSVSDLGFSLWVVKSIEHNNGMSNGHNVTIMTSYNFSGGMYDSPQREYRGFNIAEENTSIAIIKHFFHQDIARNGKEYRKTTSDQQQNPYGETDQIWIYASQNGYYLVNLTQKSDLTYDGSSNSPKNVTTLYAYDAYNNPANTSYLGDVAVNGDERYEYITYVYNTTAWIVNKAKNYSLFAADGTTRLKGTAYAYDGLAIGQTPLKGSVSMKEDWLNNGASVSTNYTYDSVGNIANVTDANRHITQYIYGLQDSTRTFPERSISALNRTTSYRYDLGTGNLLSETDSNGIVKNYTYDGFGRKSADILPYDSVAYPTTEYSYIFDGSAPEIILVKNRDINGSSSSLDEYQFYDGFGRLIQKKMESDNSLQIANDVYYDSLGRLDSRANPSFTAFSSSYSAPNTTIDRTHYRYDPLSRVIKITNPDASFKNISYNHWNITVIDEKGNRTDYALNAYSQISIVKEFNGNESYSTLYTYDGVDNLIGIKDNANNTINYTYDSLGRKIKLIDPDMGTINYTYDSVGNLIAQKDNNGTTLTFQYDDINRKTKDIAPSGNITYVYDLKLNNTLSQVQSSSLTINYTYDNKLRKTKEEKIIDSKILPVSFTYDSMDRVTSKTLPSGEIIVNQYNLQGALGSITNVANFTYNEKSQPSAISYNNTLTSNYTYNASNFRLVRLKTASKQDLAYKYDSSGNVLEINDSTNNKLTALSYDALNRLISTNITVGSQPLYLLNFVYNSIGNMLNSTTNTQNTVFYYNSSRAHAPYRVDYN